jgi:hypothetical protein
MAAGCRWSKTGAVLRYFLGKLEKGEMVCPALMFLALMQDMKIPQIICFEESIKFKSDEVKKLENYKGR